MRRGQLRRLAALCAAGLAVAAGAGCGTGGSESSDSGSGGGSGAIKAGPGVDLDARTITIGNIVGISGPAAPIGQNALAGFETAVKAINDAGGVEGFTLKPDVRDAAYVPQNAVSTFNGMQSSVALAVNFGSPTTQAILPAVKAANMVVLPFSWDSAWGRERNLAPLATPYAYEVVNGLDYLTQEKKLGDKVGIIYQDDAFGEDGLHGFRAAVRGLGLKNVAEATEAVGDTDFTAQVQKMKSAGAEIVVLATLPSASGPIVGTASTLGYNPTYLFLAPGFLESMITKTGALDAPKTPIAPALARSTYVTTFATAWGNPRAPGMADMLEDVRKYAPKQIPSVYFTYAWSQAHLAAAILRKAIENRDLSREGILDARLNLGTYDSGGVTPTLEYTPELGPPSTASLINRIDPSVLGFLEPVASEYESAATSEL